MLHLWLADKENTMQLAEASRSTGQNSQTPCMQAKWPHINLNSFRIAQAFSVCLCIIPCPCLSPYTDYYSIIKIIHTAQEYIDKIDDITLLSMQRNFPYKWLHFKSICAGVSIIAFTDCTQSQQSNMIECNMSLLIAGMAYIA